MAGFSMRPCGDFRTGYGQEVTLFPTVTSLRFLLAGVALLLIAPFFLDRYYLTLLIQIGYLGIAALGLNIVTGFTGQISLGHAAFFGFGAFCSAWLNNSFGVPVLLAVPLAGLATTFVGMLFGAPAARIRGLYLAIATLAAQYILEDFFNRATWFTGGAAGAVANPVSLFGHGIATEQGYFYVVLFFVVTMYLFAANLFRTRTGRALLAIRDHYIAAEIMGISLPMHRILAFGISAFYAGVAGALMGHFVGFVSTESINLLLSIQMLGMVIIGGLGSVMGSLLGTAFMVLLPEVLDGAVHTLKAVWAGVDDLLGQGGLHYLKEISVGLVIVVFLIFEPEGLAHRWRLVKSYWKLYPFSH